MGASSRLRAATRWNHNIHCHRLVLDKVPDHAGTALDVGTGDGLLAAELRGKVGAVTAIDIDGPVLDVARRLDKDIDWVHGDVLAYPFGRSFDVVASIATVHHLPDLPAALARLAELTAPGGVLVIVGLARSTRPVDFAIDSVGALQHRWWSWRKGYWEHTAPTVLPPHSYSQVRQCAVEILPGARWRRLPMFRYALDWHKPH